jgi:hypothetical protein
MEWVEHVGEIGLGAMLFLLSLAPGLPAQNLRKLTDDRVTWRNLFCTPYAVVMTLGWAVGLALILYSQ